MLRPLPLTSEGARGGGDAQGGVASVVVQTCVEQTGTAGVYLSVCVCVLGVGGLEGMSVCM